MTLPDHYFTESPASAHEPREVTLRCGERTLICRTDAGVFSRQRLDPGSALLLEALAKALPADFSDRALDLGCGWGAVGLCLACRFPQAELTLCDVNRRALDLAERNFARNGLRGTFHLSDGLADVPGEFALIATNPPIRAGKAVLWRLFAESRARLAPGGALFVVIRKQQGAPSALAHLRGLFDAAEVVARGGGYWVIRCRVAGPAVAG
jgi:16S rRNA (guanine1207-N2)-methyltransferase